MVGADQEDRTRTASRCSGSGLVVIESIAVVESIARIIGIESAQGIGGEPVEEYRLRTEP